MKGRLFAIGGLLGASMVSLGTTAPPQEPSSVPRLKQPISQGQAIAPEGTDPASVQFQQGNTGQEARNRIENHQQEQKIQDADR